MVATLHFSLTSIRSSQPLLHSLELGYARAQQQQRTCLCVERANSPSIAAFVLFDLWKLSQRLGESSHVISRASVISGETKQAYQLPWKQRKTRQSIVGSTQATEI